MPDSDNEKGLRVPEEPPAPPARTRGRHSQTHADKAEKAARRAAREEARAAQRAAKEEAKAAQLAAKEEAQAAQQADKAARQAAREEAKAAKLAARESEEDEVPFRAPGDEPTAIAAAPDEGKAAKLAAREAARAAKIAEQEAEATARDEALATLRAQREERKRERDERRFLRRQAQKRWGARRVVAIFASAILLVVALRASVVTVVVAEGDAMAPTLRAGDWTAVRLCAYWFDEPGRFDVVLCRYPNHNDSALRRVVGLPGEMVMLRGGTLFVNGRAIAEDYVAAPDSGDFGPILVPDGTYFVLGDQRAIPGDSRLTSVGPVARRDIRGRALGTFWPLNGARWVE